MNLVEISCAKIVNEKRLEWFSVRHAKAFCAVCKYYNLRFHDLALLTQISPFELKTALQDLQSNRLIRYSGECYKVEDREEALQRLLWLAQKGEKTVAKETLKS